MTKMDSNLVEGAHSTLYNMVRYCAFLIATNALVEIHFLLLWCKIIDCGAQALAAVQNRERHGGTHRTGKGALPLHAQHEMGCWQGPDATNASVDQVCA